MVVGVNGLTSLLALQNIIDGKYTSLYIYGFKIHKLCPVSSAKITKMLCIKFYFRDKRREWRCVRNCPLNITKNGSDLRWNLVEFRGQTVKNYGFVPEREEHTRHGERRRMGGRCVTHGCHSEGEWLDVPRLLYHVHGRVHQDCLSETS